MNRNVPCHPCEPTGSRLRNEPALFAEPAKGGLPFRQAEEFSVHPEAFGDCVLNSATREISRGGKSVHLEPKAFALLELLVAARPRAVSKAELQDALWPKTYVSERSLARLLRGGAGSGTTPILYSTAWVGDPLQVFVQRPEVAEPVPLGPSGAALLAVSPSGEVALALDCKKSGRNRLCSGTLAKAPLAGGSPREVYAHVQQADWSPDGSAIAVVSDVENKSRLEFPPGKVLYETQGHVSYPRFSPGGDAIAFFDHALPSNDRASLAVVDLSGKKRVLTAEMEVAHGLAWSPSGKEIWFTARWLDEGFVGIQGVTLSGRRRLIARAPGVLRLHDVFRDGRALVSEDALEWRVFALGPGETRERDLTWIRMSILGFLSPDGKTLLFRESIFGEQYSWKAAGEACLRRTDGSPVVVLGNGHPLSLSPDGKWVLARPTQVSTKEPYALIPTGPGFTSFRYGRPCRLS